MNCVPWVRLWNMGGCKLNLVHFDGKLEWLLFWQAFSRCHCFCAKNFILLDTVSAVIFRCLILHHMDPDNEHKCMVWNCPCFDTIIWVDGEMEGEGLEQKVWNCLKKHPMVLFQMQEWKWTSSGLPLLPLSLVSWARCTDRSLNHEDIYWPLPSFTLFLALCTKPLSWTEVFWEMLFRSGVLERLFVLHVTASLYRVF